MATETTPAAAPRLLLGPPLVRAARPSPAADDAPESHPFLDLLGAAFNAPSAAEAKAALTDNCNATHANSIGATPASTSSSTSSRPRPPRACATSSPPPGPATRSRRSSSPATSAACAAPAIWLPQGLSRAALPPRPRPGRAQARHADKARREGKQLAEQRLGLRARLAGRKRAHEAATSTRSVSVTVAEQKTEAMEVDHKASRRGVPKKTYYGDRAYRFLFDAVADFFAALLASDMKQMAPGSKKRKIGLAAKWCPTPGSSFDRATLLCEAIACRLFPRDSDPEYAELSDEHYSYRVLRRLRREVLVPIRNALELPEVYMCAQRWDELPYARVASVAMRRYKALFQKHDEERFAKYLEDVEAGKAKIAAGAVVPHEIAAAAYRGEEDEVAELQWRRMVDDLRAKGSLRNCISICDVSGSMEGTPMEVAIALGVLTSELSEEPWAGKVITFHTGPIAPLRRLSCELEAVRHLSMK
ncbi:hypothetical protein ZWY2020_000573 [Hordeum vulgare]|nr:hypothetical protein ZWY2020_000573 [Hordeum vulgare]